MEQDVSKLHVSVNDVETPNVLDPVHQLSHNKSRLFLTNSLACLEEHAEVESIAIVHQHVNIRARLNSLIQLDRVWAVHEGVDTNLFLDALHIFRGDVRYIDDLARIDRLSGVWCRSIALLFPLVDLVSNLLGFYNLAILALTQLIVHVDEETVDLAHVRLLGLLRIGLGLRSCLGWFLFLLFLLLRLHIIYKNNK